MWSLHGHDVAIRPQIQKNCVSKVHVAAHSLPVKFRMFQTPFRQRLSGPGCVCARTSCDDGRRNRQQQDSTASRAGEVDTEYVRTYRFNSVNLCWGFLLQERIAASFGSQCGFCTPGIVMSMYTLLRNNPVPTQEQLQSAFEGDKC